MKTQRQIVLTPVRNAAGLQRIIIVQIMQRFDWIVKRRVTYAVSYRYLKRLAHPNFIFK